MRTVVHKIKAIMLVVILLVSPVVAAELPELKIVTSADSVIQGEQISVTVLHNGMPIENVFLQFRSDGGTPIYAQTNATGGAVFKPDVTGTLEIVAIMDDEMSARKYITVTQSSDGGGDGGDGGDNGGISYWWSGSVTVPLGTFTKTAFDTGKGYTITWQTALGALQKASEVGGFSYEIEETTWGPFVYSIEDKKKYAEGETSGWMYQVNGESPMIGAHEYSVTTGDEIIWYFSESMDTTPSTSTRVLKITIASSPAGDGEGGGGISTAPTSTPTPVPTKIAEETRTIEYIEAGGNASLTFNKTEVTRIVINANKTIRNAEVTIRPVEKPVTGTNVVGIPYCYFDIIATNLTDTDMLNASIEFKVNRTIINESDIDETTITLSKYSYSDNNWSALPTSKLKEDNTSLFFESKTQSFSLFAISGHEKPAYLAIGAETEAETGAETGAETETPMPATTAAPGQTRASLPASAPLPMIPMFMAVVLIALTSIVCMLVVTQRRKK
jgi:PGF-pre-PGF domain-containing protein